MQITVSKKFLLTFAGTMVILLSVFGVYYFMSNKNNTNTTSVLSAENNTNPMYFPADLPAGYEVDKQSISTTSDVSAYTISSTTTIEKIFVSIQPKPEESILNKFHTEQLGLPETINTPIEDVVIGQVRGRYTSSLVTDDQWVIVTAPLEMNYDDLKTIVTSIEQE